MIFSNNDLSISKDSYVNYRLKLILFSHHFVNAKTLNLGNFYVNYFLKCVMILEIVPNQTSYVMKTFKFKCWYFWCKDVLSFLRQNYVKMSVSPLKIVKCQRWLAGINNQNKLIKISILQYVFHFLKLQTTYLIHKN